MGQKQSKDRLLYQYVVNGDVEGIQFLSKQGASLEWKDKEGRTPLIVAAKDPALYGIAKTLVELGANVNAFCKGHHGGTPLHYAAKEGLDRTVALLLSHGANAFVQNRENQTPLDVARKNGRNLVVREIEGRICYFAGQIREASGLGFSAASASQLSSGIIWVVIVPRSPHNPPKRPKLELVMYSTSEDAEPRRVVSLRRCKIKEPRFDQPSPTLIIFDRHNKTRYKFSPVNYNEKQQLRWLYNACKGISQVMPVSGQIDAESWGSSLQTAVDSGTPMTPNTNMNGRNVWKYSISSPSPNTWRSPGRLSPPMTPRSNFWVHESPRGRDKIAQGTAESWSAPNLSPHRGGQANSYSPSPMLQTPDRFPAAISATVPSAPPISTDTTTEVAIKNQPDSSSCVVCWEAPVEAACIPCGHVSSCLFCLKQIKDNNGVCPVCRAHIDQVVKLYNI